MTETNWLREAFVAELEPEQILALALGEALAVICACLEEGLIGLCAPEEGEPC